ncbi:hypothetical protein QT882_09580 [Xanthomonas fragariae]|nr:hypothetical protein [Xanthomonas fragariae]MDM7578813.1 hypothetical protein [Xanthomonas fragariae]
MPEQVTDLPVSPGTVASGMASPSGSSGVLSELPARPTKLLRTEASAVHSAPGSGAIPGQNGTSMPFHFALPYDYLGRNSHAHHLPLGRADVPEPQWTAEQQPAFEDAAVHEERQVQVGCPSTSCDVPSEFAKLSGKIRRGTVLSGSDTPYPADSEFIAQLVDAAGKRGDKLVAIKRYVYLLIRFSDWLRQRGKAGLQKRLCQDKESLRQDKEALKRDASDFQKGSQGIRLNAALTHLRKIASANYGAPKIRLSGRYEVPDGDKQLIDGTLSASPAYASPLRAFSEWLNSQNKQGLSETGRLHSETLMDDAKAFAGTCMAGSRKAVAALRKLQELKLTGAPFIPGKHLDTSDINEDDRQIVEHFKATLWVSSGGRTYAKGETYASKTSRRLTRFSVWLKKNNKAPMASRLYDKTLDQDFATYINSLSLNVRSQVKTMLSKVRETYPPDVQLPDQGGIAEPTGSSYSSMIPHTPEGGWPQAPEGDWNPDTPEDEVAGPSSSAQPEVSSYDIPFDWEALYQEATEPQHTTEMSQASILSFDEKDTGPGWKPGAQQVPDWLLQHKVRDEQMVRICGINYSVSTKQRDVGGVKQAKLYLNPLYP